ncbi:MAG: hypothetical protein ACLUA1_10385, partial [Ruminococcus callidus]
TKNLTTHLSHNLCAVLPLSKDDVRLFYRLYCAGSGKQLCAAAVCHISENLSDFSVEDYISDYH